MTTYTAPYQTAPTRLHSSALRALSTRPGEPVSLADSRAAVELCQQEIFQSGLKYRSIADAAGVCVSTVMKLAHGDVNWPRLETMIRILMVLGWTIVAMPPDERRPTPSKPH
jgi:predicted XRE-type DNA-binding protein